MEPDRLGVYFVLPDIEVSEQIALALSALKGGARTIQLRTKGASTRTTVETATRLKTLCAQHEAVLIINDRLDIALASGADGVHLGQDDLPVDMARRLAGEDIIIGASVSSPAQASEAVRLGSDYVAVSPVFDTPTKSDTGPALGLDGTRAICESVSVPVVGIGGIKNKHVRSLVQAGITSIAVVSEIASANDPETATATLAKELRLSLVQIGLSN